MSQKIDTYIKNENGEVNIYIEGQKYLPHEIPAYKAKVEQYEIRIAEYLDNLIELRQDKKDLRKDKDDLRKSLTKTVQEKEDFEKRYQEAIKNISQLKSEENTDPIYQQALAFFLKLELQKALDLLETVNHEDEFVKTAEKHRELGNQAMLKGNIYRLENREKEKQNAYLQAIKHFQVLIEIYPQDFEANFQLGYAFNKLENYTETEKYYLKALEVEPDYDGTWNNLGILYSRLKRYDKAENAYLNAVKVKPDAYQVWDNLGLLYGEKLADYERAKIAFQNCLDIKPDFYKAISNLGLVYLFYYKDYIKARSYFRKANDIESSYDIAILNIAMTYGSERNKEKSLKYLAQVFQISTKYKKRVQNSPAFEWLWEDADFLALVQADD